jgi:hypothetical protein
MLKPVAMDLTAYRWQPYVEDFRFEGLTLAGCSPNMQVRLYPDAPGSPLINLAGASAPTQGISLAAPTIGGILFGDIQVRIDEATLEALLPAPNGTEPGKPLVLAYDLVLTGHPTFGKFRLLQGAFLLMPGVTQ